jgi:hypothetical protein
MTYEEAKRLWLNNPGVTLSEEEQRECILALARGPIVDPPRVLAPEEHWFWRGNTMGW